MGNGKTEYLSIKEENMSNMLTEHSCQWCRLILSGSQGLLWVQFGIQE
jgi:hypothetical protein